MAFKSEIHVAELASIRTGHAEGDIYYILDNGMLGDIPCKPGTFVKWHNDAWQIQPDEHYALASAVDGEIAQAIDNLLDNGQASETIVVAVPSSQSSNYTVGNYYEVQGKVAKLRTKTDGDNVTQLTFDTTSGLLDAINDIVEDITSIGSPLQWKGPATVAQLNAGITGIQPGWTYTLTDAGTLTDGSVAVEAGDEVAWTEGDEWFKVGGDSGKIAVFEVTFPSGVKTYPNGDEILSAIDAGKFVVIDEPNIGVWNHLEWLLKSAGRGAQDYIKFVNGSGTLIAARDNTADEPTWQWDTGDLYDDQLDANSTNAVQNSTLYTVIGDVESLLAAL